MTAQWQQAPRSICILRLSAIGDICHTLPVIRTLQHAWPDTKLTWIIGKAEYSLLYDIPDIEFIVFDKSRGWRAYAEIWHLLRIRSFDVLLHMQMSARASIISMLVHSPVKIGFDRARAKDLQWLFTNSKIATKNHEHVVDSLFGFTDTLNIHHRQLVWNIPVPSEASKFAHEQLPQGRYIVISPCSSMRYRNWHSKGYADVAIHAVQQYGLNVVICGGNSDLERHYAEEITAYMERAGVNTYSTNLIGRTNLKQLLAVLERAEVLISPDSGPAHLATAVNTKVIGLYACTNPKRAGPYLSNELTVNHYPEAIKLFTKKEMAEIPWGMRIKDSSAMNLITADEVIHQLDNVLSNN